MKSFTKRAFFPEGAFNVRVSSESAKSEDSDESTPVLEVVVQASDQHHFTPPSASKKHPTCSSSSSSSTSSSSRALFTFPSKWDDAEKWLKSSGSKSGAPSSKKHPGFRKLQHHQGASQLQEGEQTEEEVETEDKEKKMMIDSSATGSVPPRFSFPMVEKSSGGGPGDVASEEKKRVQSQQTGQLRIQKPSTDLSDVQSCFDFKQQQQQQQQQQQMQQQMQPKSPTSLYESVACIAPGGQRSISMRDMGTEMTPIASQEPSRTGTPLRTPTMISPRVSPGKIRPIPPPPGTSSDPPSSTAERTDEPPLITLANPASTSATPSMKNPITVRGLNSTRQEIQVLGAQLGKSNIAAWATREEEDEDFSTSLKVAQQNSLVIDSAKPSVDLLEVRRTMVESRASAWEEAEHSKYMARFEREEAKILAWENHQKAKAEAELRRMEVKVEKMRSHAHERMMNKLAATRRRAEELRAAAEAKRGEKAAKTVERADEIRKTGRVTSTSPTHFIGCCLAGV